MKAKILVVDDDAHLRESLRDNLELEEYQITEAGSGQEALKAVVTDFYDVILMDYNLADATGIQVIQQIRKVNTESQILMMTAHASLDTVIKAIQESVYDFLVKPVDFQYLKRTISKCVEKLRLQQENQRLIKELKRANEELLNLSNMKSKFMSMSSHDLANSLMSVQLSFEILTGSLTLAADQQKRVDSIAGGISQVSRLIEDLVDWASMEQGKFRIEKSRFPLAAVIEETIVGPQARAAQRSIELRAELSADLPLVLADRRRIAQVLNNLLENAVRHTSSGGRITVRTSVQGDAVEVAVQDTGDGIAPTEVARVFGRFYQPLSAGQNSKMGRLGLGLSIAREIVTSHGGRIWVHSEGAGKGATFYFTLPAAAGPVPPVPPAAARAFGAK
ncbi:MAG: hybrid sensor histidine kinase/response regulator [Elusimicrobia bacterium]|nr:hybrid sensor histidine kinase/response regulator [Elusimicrobiota bacterium]